MSRLTDYGTVVLAHLARFRDGSLHTTAAVATATHLTPTTVSKVLKILTKANLIDSFRGSQGGYRLARPAEEITAAEIIDALEGPVSITECSVDAQQCDLVTVCGVGAAWQRINVAIRDGLEHITLAQLADPRHPIAPFDLDLEHNHTGGLTRS
ncbi:MAG: SUF system Fe-S cluster assembly regulator [Gammaproteobacteria bacterium]|nr:SUF system Fe-S cluster assembly regulator [Gammaproteobacteria bacterium]